MRALILVVLVVMGGWTQGQIVATGPGTPAAKLEELQRFDLAFPGGTPQELVDALNEPLKGTLNVIIPEEHRGVQIPPFKMKGVTVAQVFEALGQSSQRRVLQPVAPPPGSGRPISYQTRTEEYFFNTKAPITVNSVWAFVANITPVTGVNNSSVVRFYQLGPYLNNLKIEDVITAIQTSWEMLGDTKGPELKFHPETKLLIVVGKESDFGLIESLLKELPKETGAPVQAEKKAAGN